MTLAFSKNYPAWLHLVTLLCLLSLYETWYHACNRLLAMDTSSFSWIKFFLPNYFHYLHSASETVDRLSLSFFMLLLFLSCILCVTELIYFWNNPHSFLFQGFFNFTSRRPRHLLQILELGYSVMYNDVDMVWLADPFPYLQGEHDVYFTDDMTAVCILALLLYLMY